MAKQKDLSVPKVGMNRSLSPHLLQEGEYAFQLNGNSYDEGGEKFNLTDEHSNILALKFKSGFKFIGGKNHVVRDKTYIFLTNPITGVSEIGCIRNKTDFAVLSDVEVQSKCTDCPEYVNLEATPLELQVQIPHQQYETLLEDSCNLCLGFDIDNPIIDIIIKEQNIGTKLFWTSTPGNKEFRYLELDEIEQYKVTGDESCGEIPTDTCLDCDKLRVFRLYTELKIKDYQRALGGSLKKGSYEVLGAYSDQLGNEFTSYVSLTPIVPIFDEGNIIHEQEDNNAETNFSIKVELDNVDSGFEYYKIAVRYFTSKGVFSSFVEGIHNTSDNSVIISNNSGQSISNTKLSLVKPYVETVDGATTSNNILLLNGVREREPINLQPVISLAGLGVKWMSFRAKEDLYANADSYKYTGYNRDENVALAIDFGMRDGYRTNPYVFVPRPASEDELTEITSGDDFESITNTVQECDGNLRTKKWQFYNTASETGPCPSNENFPTTIQTENISTYTVVGPFDQTLNPSGIPFVPANQLIIDLTEIEGFTDLTNFIEDNKEDNVVALGLIAPYIDETNLLPYNNIPSPPTSTCDVFVLEDPQVVNIASVEDESFNFTYPPNADNYPSISEPDVSSIYSFKGSSSEMNWDFSFSYASGIQISSNINPFHFVSYVRQRQQVFANNKCSKSDELQRVEDTDTSKITRYYFHQNEGGVTIPELQDTSIDMSSNIQGTANSNDGIFTEFFHKSALWFKTKVYGRSKFYINVSENSRCNREVITMNGYGYTFGTNKTTLVRVSVFSNCNDSVPISSEIIDLRLSSFITIDNSIISNLISDNLYVSVESSIKQSSGLGPDWEINDWIEWRENTTTSGGGIAYNQVLQNGANNSSFITTYIANLPCGAWSIADRDEEPTEVSVSWSKINISKTQKYVTSCDFEIPILTECKPVPYKYGELGYYESTDTYDDNEELYDSSKLVVNKNRITNTDFLSKLDTYKQSETTSQIILSDEANFRCKNIRHFKTPDNQISPFIRNSSIASNSDSIISPLGFTIDGEVINNLLDVALDNGLITEKQREDIVDYKIYRSDSTLDRSIVGSGIVFNSKKYTVEQEDISYFNYPFNSLGKDKYFPANTDEPFDKMQVISPEFDYYRPSLPSEMSLQGYMFGKSNTRVLPVKDHAKMVILGSKAKSLAKTLATLEVVAESALNLASSAESWRFQFGFSNSANPVGIGLHIALAAIEIFSGVVHRYGKYKIEWERTFENLGAPYNFGYYTSSGSNYNYLKTPQTDGDRLRGFSVRKYLKPGMLNVSDTVSGKSIKINNIDREEAPFFSLGDYPINNLSSDYLSFDNSDITPNFSSQVLSSEIGCHKGKSPEQNRNIASPYVAFRNYIANQYGTIGSIKWIDTTYCIPIEETGICSGILGGDTFISRHSKKRKARLFETDLLGSADLTPFPYRFNSNYGDPKYYVDYKVNSEFTSGGKTFPDIFYDVAFDCHNSSNSFYVEPPGKFYLYNIAYTNFLCETRVNTNFRNARKEPWNQFYPQNTDYELISQPTTVSLTRPENFFYNKAYLQTNVLNTSFTLPEYYSRENEAKKSYNKNSVIYSLPDVNENSITEPWLLYRPNDKATIESTYGNLVNLKGIESDQILMYFENALQLQNSVNQFTDGSTNYNSELGNGGIFAKRAMTLRTTDIGYGGSQSKQTLSCEFGHFHADIKRGQVFNYTGGSNLQEISRYSNGKPNGMDVWFKEHLPLKISKQFPEYSNADNPYNGAGIHWGYDSKYRRIILTKKDYKPKGAVVNCEDKFYNANVSDYSTVINNYTSQGYEFDGVENCQLKFSKQGIDSNTDVYAIFDTTSMQASDGQAASDALNAWFINFQNSNPSFTGNLYIIPYGNEAYVSFPSFIQSGAISATTFGAWGNIANLPPNLNTSSWVPPTDLLLLAFVDETNAEYHGSGISGGFSSSGIVQPTNTYFTNYQSMVTSVASYNSFRGVIYPIVQSLTGTGGALVLQVLAAMKGTTLSASDISSTNTAVDVSVLLTENPYENAIIPGTTPQKLLEPLETYNWVAQYDKTSPASAVFTSQQFQTNLNELISADQGANVVYEPLNEIELLDSNYFEDISWTLTYKPETGSWESYMSYTPNYYINHTDYFQSGINSNDDKNGLWSHLLTNKSYRVFYGQKFPYIVEYPVKNQYISKRLEDVSWNAQLRRYHNEYDFAPIEENPFTAVTIYNNYENSGRLIPVKNNGTLSQLSKYPINNSNNSQDALISYDNYRYNMNYFYNRVNSNRSNQPIWLWDENQINKKLNDKAVSFYGKSTLERLKGNFFMIRLERDGNTNYDLDFRWSEQTVNPIR